MFRPGLLVTSLVFISALVVGTIPADAADAAVDPANAEKIRLVQELHRVMEFTDTISEMTSTMVDRMDPLRGRTPTRQDEEFFDRLKGSMKRGMARLVPEMVDATTEIYARTFSEQELRDVIAFYASPSGQSFLKKGKTVMAEAMVSMATIMRKYVAYTKEDYCAQVPCGETEERLFEALQEGVDMATGKQPVSE